MTTDTSNFLATKHVCEQDAKQEPAKHWLNRHFLRPIPWQGQESTEKIQMIRQLSLRCPRASPSIERPNTAPSPGQAAKNELTPPLPIILHQFQHLAARDERKAPTRPPRPDADVLRDVDAWLDSSKSSSPLMGGLSYWMEGVPGDTEGSTNVQYAIPIVQEPDSEKPLASHGQQLRSFCRRAKKQVRMPSIRRVKSPRVVEDDNHARSESAPILAVSYDETEPGTSPGLRTRMSAVRPSTAAESSQTVRVKNRLEVPRPHVELPLRRESPSSIRLREMECEVERLLHLSGDTLRPRGAAAANLPREDSMGSFSSAPTYFSGMPPPSYKSRPASILTTSSFGCIDGMNPEQRQLSQQRAAQKQRSMKGRLKKLAQKANFTK